MNEEQETRTPGNRLAQDRATRTKDTHRTFAREPKHQLFNCIAPATFSESSALPAGLYPVSVAFPLSHAAIVAALAEVGCRFTNGLDVHASTV